MNISETSLKAHHSLMDEYSHLFITFDPIELFCLNTDNVTRTLLDLGATDREIMEILLDLGRIADKNQARIYISRALDAIAKEDEKAAEVADTVEVLRDSVTAMIGVSSK